MNVQRTFPQAMRVGRAAHPCLSVPPAGLQNPGGQRRSCVTHHCWLDQQVLSKEVKDQERRKLMIFLGGKREGRKGQKRAVGPRERALARSLLKPAVQLHLGSSSAAKHQWTWTNGTPQGGVGKPCVSQHVWEFAHCTHQKATRQGLWCDKTLQAHGTSIPTAVQGLSLYLLWCCVYLEERLLQTAP